MGLSTPSTGGGAPKDAEYVTGSSNSELSNETVVSPAGDILTQGSFGTTVSLSPGFGTFTQVSADHPSLLLARMVVATDGSSNGSVTLQVDESGGTTPDYTAKQASADSDAANGFFLNPTATVPLPAGAQFVLNNDADPKGVNSIETVQAMIITP